jgi:hypothetical protein
MEAEAPVRSGTNLGVRNQPDDESGVSGGADVLCRREKDQRIIRRADRPTRDDRRPNG